MYVGCHSWETALIVQAFCSTGLTEEFCSTLQKAHQFLKNAQVYWVYVWHIFIEKHCCKLTSIFSACRLFRTFLITKATTVKEQKVLGLYPMEKTFGLLLILMLKHLRLYFSLTQSELNIWKHFSHGKNQSSHVKWRWLSPLLAAKEKHYTCFIFL